MTSSKDRNVSNTLWLKLLATDAREGHREDTGWNVLELPTTNENENENNNKRKKNKQSAVGVVTHHPFNKIIRHVQQELFHFSVERLVWVNLLHEL